MEVYVGVCSFSYKYLENYNALEIQSTFYNIPKMSTVEKWRKSAQDEFKFSFKVFQGITHEYRSRTWRRYRGKDLDKIKAYVGGLKLNEITKEYWKKTVEIAKILKAEVIIVQTPPSFKPSEESISNAEKTFIYVDQLFRKEGIKTIVGWEPRGSWINEEEKIKKILGTTERLIHIVDPFYHKSITVKKTQYFRLHGRPYLNYRYEYKEEDYKELMRKLEEAESEGAEKIFVMFNNIKMDKNAKEFKEILRREGWKVY